MNIRTHILRLAALVGFALLASAPAAYASTTTTSFQVQTAVAGTCGVNASNLNFGTYDGSVGKYVNTTLSVNCTRGEAVNVELGFSGNTLGGNQRRMQSLSPAGNYLEYSLNKTNSCNNTWGTGGNGMAITGAGYAVPYTVYGCMPSGQTGTVQGSYQDTVQVTLNY